MMDIQMIFDRYFGDSDMTNVASNTSAVTPATAAETKQIVLKDIGAKWDKFSQQDLTAIKGRDDLVAQVVAKYGLEKAQAQRDVDTVLNGRVI